MDTLQIFILGVVQGISEFLPVSSSGHLILIPYLFSWPLQTLTFDVALHLGTLAALIYCFGRDLWNQLREQETAIKLILATLPAALAGLLLENFIESSSRNAFLVSGNLIIFGLLLGLADRQGEKDSTVKNLTRRDALFIGFFQILALFPGVSRSGITITAGLFRRLNRVEAAEFSFLIAIPIIAGAGLFEISQSLSTSQTLNLKELFLGAGISALIGVLSIRYLLKFLKNHSLQTFVIYRIILGLSLLLLLL